MKRFAKQRLTGIFSALVALVLLCSLALPALAEGGGNGPAQATSHTVEFRDWDGALLASGEVLHGGDATPPETPQREGHAFTGWQPVYTNVQGDLVVYAGYRPLASYTVTVEYLLPDYTQAAQPFAATLPEGSSLQQTVPSPPVTGYAPEQASVELDIASITADETILVMYHPANTAYSVRHLFEKTEGGYDEQPEAGLPAYTAQLVTPTPLEVAGFTPQAVAPAPVAADGSTVFTLYYERATYAIYYETEGGSYLAPVQYKYGASLAGESLPDNTAVTRMGYSFDGWLLNGQTATALPAEMPAHDLVYTAKWADGDAPYLVVYWLEAANSDEYEYIGYKEYSGPVGTTPTVPSGTDGANFPTTTRIFATNNGSASEIVSVENYSTRNEALTQQELQGVTIQDDGSTVVNVYYDRNRYTLTFSTYLYSTALKLLDSLGDMKLEVDGVLYGMPNNNYYNYKNSVDSRVYERDTGNEVVFTEKDTATTPYQIRDVKVGQDITEWFPTGVTKYDMRETGWERYVYGWRATKPGSGDPVPASAAKDFTYADYGSSLDYYSPARYPSGGIEAGKAQYIMTGAMADLNLIIPDVTVVQSFSFELVYRAQSLDDSTQYEEISRTTVTLNRGLSYYSLAAPTGMKLLRVTGKNANGEPLTVNLLSGTNLLAYNVAAHGQDGEITVDFNRVNYQLTLYNDGESYLTLDDVPYGTSLGEVLKNPTHPSGLAGFTLAGWYTMHGSVEVPFDTQNATMPAVNLALNSHWNAPILPVTFVYGNDTPDETVQVAYGEKVAKPADPVRPGYTFKGWYAGGETLRYLFSAEVRRPLTLTAQWEDAAPSYSYTVVYRLQKAGGATEVYDSKTMAAVPGVTYTEAAIVIDGYLPDAVSKSIDATADGLELVFLYAPFTEAGYTVRYRSLADGAVLLPDEVKTTTQSYVTESFKLVAGHRPVEYQLTLQLSQLEGENLLTFYYTTSAETGYTVNHYLQGLDGSYTLTDTDTPTAPMGTTVTANPRGYTGYSLNTAKSTSTGVVLAGGGTTLALYYDRDTYSVVFVSGAGGTLNGTQTQVVMHGTPFGSITLPTLQPDEGYTFDGWQPTLPTDGDEITGNLYFTATWRPTGEAYAVHHWLQRATDGEYELADTEYIRAEYDDDVAANVRSLVHYSLNSEKSTLTGRLTPAGLALHVYYDLDTVTLHFTSEAGGSLSGETTLSLLHGAPFGSGMAPGTRASTGYVFAGWSPALPQPGTPVLESTTYTATWMLTTEGYTVHHWLQQPDGSYTLDATETLQAEYGSTVNAVTRSYAHYGVNTALSRLFGAVNETGLVLDVYYDLATVTVQFASSEGGSLSGEATQSLPYGAAFSRVAVPTPVAASGWYFTGWSPSLPQGGTLVTGSLHFTAQFAREDDGGTGTVSPPPSSSRPGGAGSSSSAVGGSTSTSSSTIASSSAVAPSSTSAAVSSTEPVEETGTPPPTEQPPADDGGSIPYNLFGAGAALGDNPTHEELVDATGSVRVFGNEIPTGSFVVTGAWSLLSLLLALLSLLCATALAITTLLGKRRGKNNATTRRARLPRLLAALLGVLPMVFFLLLESLQGQMALLSRWTPLALLLCLLHLAVALAALAYSRRQAAKN